MTTDTSPSTAQSGYTDWLAQETEHTRRVAELRPSNKATLFDALARAGITRVVVNFDGEGDSGQIERIDIAPDEIADLPEERIEYAEPVLGHPDRIDRTMVTVRDAVEHLVYRLLEENHGGWEDNDGSCGEFTFDVEDRTITLDFNWRRTEYDTSSHTF